MPGSDHDSLLSQQLFSPRNDMVLGEPAAEQPLVIDPGYLQVTMIPSGFTEVEAHQYVFADNSMLTVIGSEPGSVDELGMLLTDGDGNHYNWFMHHDETAEFLAGLQQSAVTHPRTSVIVLSSRGEYRLDVTRHHDGTIVSVMMPGLPGTPDHQPFWSVTMNKEMWQQLHADIVSVHETGKLPVLG